MEEQQLIPLEKACFLDRYTNSDLFINIVKLNTISSSEKSEQLLSILYLFNDYLDNININNHSMIIENLLELFKEKKEKRPEVNLINFIKSLISQYITQLLDIVFNFDDDIIKSNSTIIYYFNYSIYKSILILYSYEFYLTMINNYINKYENTIFVNFIKYIIDNDIDIVDNSDYESIRDIKEAIQVKKQHTCVIKQDTKENISLMTKVYKIIIKKFIKEILLIDNIEKLSLNIIKIFAESNIIHYSINTNNINTKLRNTQYMYLIIKNYLIVTKISVSNNYITIPQYMGICWYVSILTGMCYSDASRKLITSKFEDLNAKLDNLDNPIKKSDKSFIDAIIYIITNITNKKLTYGSDSEPEDSEQKCDIYKYLKNKVPEFILNKINELCLSDKSITKSIGDNDYYFINICDKLKAMKLKNLGQITFDNILANVGINTYGFFILNTLYN
jgi:hypothetical protein